MATWNKVRQAWEFADGELEAQAEAALASEPVRATGPEALRVSFHGKSRRFTVYMSNGVNFSFPADLCQGLQGKSDQELAEVQVLTDGEVLEWPRLDVHLSVTGLALGLLGSARWMQTIADRVRKDAARRAGRATSDKKAASSAVNGRAGGRPKGTARKPPARA